MPIHSPVPSVSLDLLSDVDRSSNFVSPSVPSPCNNENIPSIREAANNSFYPSNLTADLSVPSQSLQGVPHQNVLKWENKLHSYCTER